MGFSNIEVGLVALLYDIGKIGQRVKPKKDFLKFTEEFLKQLDILDKELITALMNQDEDHSIIKIIHRAVQLNKEKLPDCLSSPFKKIHGIKDVSYKPKDYFYDINDLSSFSVYPKLSNQNHQYDDIWDRLVNEYKEIDFSNLKEEQIFNKIYSLLEKYTSFIPSNDPSISLFDDLKTTSAIAACLNETKNQDEFLLFEGDLSGIQKFIYQVTEGENTKSYVAKSLRGRSMFVKLLNEFISKFVVNHLKLPLSNVLYCGGGNFQLLLPKTEEVITKLESLKSDIETYLYDNYKTDLSIVFGNIDITLDELRHHYSDKVQALKEQIKLNKKQKFVNLIEKDENFFVSKKDNHAVCQYCDTKVASKTKKGLHICSTCDYLINFGEEIVKDDFQYIVYDFENKESQDSVFTIHLGHLGQIHILNSIQNKDYYLIESINHVDKNARVKYIANLIPKYNNKEIVTFDELADKTAVGAKKIGVLKMDVDNLGSIFALGLETKSVSQVSTISRLIDLFFTYELNHICQSIYQKQNNQDIDGYYYINYAGGDDLVIIGAWDKIVTLAKEISDKFKEFVCLNPHITLSGGISIVYGKEPIRESVMEAENSLSKAKNEDAKKNKLVIFNKAFSYDKEVDSLLNQQQVYLDFFKQDLSTSFIYRFMQEGQNFEDEINLNKIPLLVYSINRNITNKKMREHFMNLVSTVDNNFEDFKNSSYSIKLALMKVREN